MQLVLFLALHLEARHRHRRTRQNRQDRHRHDQLDERKPGLAPAFQLHFHSSVMAASVSTAAPAR